MDPILPDTRLADFDQQLMDEVRAEMRGEVSATDKILNNETLFNEIVAKEMDPCKVMELEC
jgi:hypothetical protein